MILLKHGDLIDGTGSVPRRADVLIEGKTIRDVGVLDHVSDAEMVDCQGLAVCPGFIDVHSHSDLEALQHRSEKICQGVTTEVTGNCSFSPFPSGQAGPEQLRAALGSTLRSQAEWDWTTLDGWAGSVHSRGTSLNLAPLVGHGAIRVAAGVTENRPPTDDELRILRDEVDPHSVYLRDSE